MTDRVIDILNALFSSLGVHDLVLEQSTVAGQHIYTITGPEEVKKMMNAHADMIHSIEHMVKKIIEKDTEHEGSLFVIDIDGRRVAHIRDIETRAKMMAERAKSFQYDVELAPMSAYDRLIIHTALQNVAQVKTESQGEGRTRRIVIKYVG